MLDAHDLEPAAGIDTDDIGGWWTSLVDLYRAEAKHAGTPARAARHLCEAARILAEQLVEADAARKAYEEAHDLAPDDLVPIRALARLAMQTGHWSAARRWLDRALGLTPDGPERVAVLARLAEVLQDRLGARADAYRHLREAVRAAPDDPVLLARLSLAIPEDDPTARLEVLKRRLALESAPRARAALLLDIARLHEAVLSDDEAALQAYSAALEADPKALPALEGVVRVHTRQGRWETLVDALMQGVSGIEDEGARGRLVYLSALVSVTRLASPERARLFLGQAAMHLPDDPTVMREIIADYEALGMWGPANTLLEALARAVPESAAASWYRAGLNAESGTGQPALAVECYARALVAEPHHLPALSGMRRCAWRADDMGAYMRAVEPLAEAADSQALKAALRTHLGDVAALRLDDRPEARRHYEAAVRAALSGPGPHVLPPALVALHGVLLAQAAFEQARDALEAAAERSLEPPARAWVHDALGTIYETRLNRPAAAIRHFEAALALDPDNRRAIRAVQRLLAQEGDRAALVAALESEAADAEAARKLALYTRAADTYEALGDPAGVERCWRAALEVEPGWLAALRGLGRLLFQHGRWRDLAALLKHELAQLPEEAPERAGVLGKLGELYEFRLDAPDDAAAAYEGVVVLRPSAPDALAGLERLYGGMERWGELARVLEARAAHIEDPRDRAAVLFRMAEIRHEHAGDLDDALDGYEAAIELDPQLLPAAWALERLVVARGDRERLVMLYRTLLPRLRTAGQRAVVAHKLAALLPPAEARSLLSEQGPADADAAWGLVREAAECGDRAQLSQRLARVAQLVGERRDALALWREAAESAEGAGVAPADRVALWERVLPLSPDSKRPWEALLRLHRETPTDLAVALVRLARTSEDDRTRSVALWNAGRLEDGAARRELAGDLYGEAQNACELDPVPVALLLERAKDAAPLERAALLEALAARLGSGHDAAARLMQAGLCADEGGDPDRALKAYVAAVRRDPMAEDAAMRAAAMLQERRGFDELAALLQRRIRRLESPVALVPLLQRLADVQIGALGDREAAGDTLERLVELAPADAGSRRMLADLRYGQERWPEAAAQYEWLVESGEEPDLVHLFTRLGQIRAHHLNDIDGAIEQLRRAVGLLDPDGRALEELAAVYLMADEPDMALLAYQRLERVADDDSRLAASRAGQVRALLARGRRAEALEQLTAFRRADPVDPMLAALARDLDARGGPAGPAEELLPRRELPQSGAVLAAVQLDKVEGAPEPQPPPLVEMPDAFAEPPAAPPVVMAELEAPAATQEAWPPPMPEPPAMPPAIPESPAMPPPMPQVPPSPTPDPGPPPMIEALAPTRPIDLAEVAQIIDAELSAPPEFIQPADAADVIDLGRLDHDEDPELLADPLDIDLSVLDDDDLEEVAEFAAEPEVPDDVRPTVEQPPARPPTPPLAATVEQPALWVHQPQDPFELDLSVLDENDIVEAVEAVDSLERVEPEAEPVSIDPRADTGALDPVEPRSTMPYGHEYVPAPPAPRPPVPNAEEAGAETPPGGRTETGMPVLVMGAVEAAAVVDDAAEPSGLGDLPPGAGISITESLTDLVVDGTALERDARARLAKDPMDADAWRDLRRGVAAGGSTACAAWLRGVGSWVMGEVRPAPPCVPRGAVEDALRRPLLPDSVPANLLMLLRAVGPTIAPAFGRRGRGGSEERVAPHEGLHQMARRLGVALDVDAFDVVRNAARPYTVTVDAGDRTTVTLGTAIVGGADDAGRSFLLGRCLVPLREGTLAARKLSAREFRAFLGALLELLGAKYPVRARDRATYERIRGDLEPLLATDGDGNAEWTALASAAASGLATFPPSSVRAGLELYAARLALALSDGFGGAFEMLRLQDFDDRPRSALDRADVEQFLADSEIARDLLLFAGSPECLAIRAWLAGEAG